MERVLSIFLLLIIISMGFINNPGDESKQKPEKIHNNHSTDVYLQGFYWNSPPGGIWFDSLHNIAGRLASAGFGAIWIPPAAKGGGGMSMGYDIYDHYDFGEFNQKGSLKTRFGSRAELERMVNKYKSLNIELLFDAVLNHAGNGDAKSVYECSTDSGWVIFNPLSGRFPKTAVNFHPNNVHCDLNPPYHNKIFFEDLCYFSGGTGDSLIAWGNYILNTLNFDGFRIDAVKHIEPGFIAAFSQAFPGVYMAGEHWSSIGEIIAYHNQVSSLGGNVSFFDFPLRYAIKDMCNNTSGSYDMNNLYGAGLINNGMSPFNVTTFVENHDFDRIGWDGSIDYGHDPVLFDKPMGYALIIFSEGRPSVFYKDYFDYGNGGKIDTLIWIRKTFLYGTTIKGQQLNPWFVGSGSQTELSKDLYVARRNGGNGKPQAFLVLNDHPTQWRGVWVDSDHPNQWFRDYTGVAIDKQAAGDGRVELYAPPRGYAIYVPDTTQSINYPPVLNKIPDLTGFTNSLFNYQVVVNDANNDPLSFVLTGNPQWLTITSSGLLNGTPTYADTGSSIIILEVIDSFGASDVDTFKLTVEFNLPPFINNINDTTIRAAVRFEHQATAGDPDGDTVYFNLTQAPVWLNVGQLSGLISGTPAPEDTGSYPVKVKVTDGKGAFDSTQFTLNVLPAQDSIIYTYGKPFLDGNINIGPDDWLEEWIRVVDSDSDSYWRPPDSLDNEMLAILVTWDADSLYLGVDYVCNDNFNTMILYIDSGIEGGITNFNSTQGYTGDYPKNFRFRQTDAINLFVASYFLDNPVVFKTEPPGSANITSYTNPHRGENARGAEVAIAWNTIYGLGAGLVPPYVELKFVGVIAGGFNWGAGDSAPDNPDVNGDAGPDSLIFLVSVFPDTNGDGIPDPTIIIPLSTKEISSFLPDKYFLYQNYPNPFNPSTTIRFDLPEAGFITLAVFDILGREVKTLLNEFKPSGRYNVKFDAAELSSGVYIYTIRSANFYQARKMLLLK